MSLNGLEAVEVSEAYQSALNEGGGWFLLKYNTRDEVALLQRGKGGVAEVQEVVHGYEEESPLYGFIHYRRRKVVLKYVPDGTSRLLLARLAVHFEFIKERFSPYDTIFTFAEAYELSDSTLSSTCSLHTAASIKSLRDSPSKNLAGVKEEEGSENGTVRSPGSEAGTIRNSNIGADIAEEGRPSVESLSSSRPDGDSAAQPKPNGNSTPSKTRERTSSLTTQSLRPRTASNTDKDLPPTPKFTSPYSTEKASSIYDHSDFTYRSSIDTRISSNSARPSTRELNRAYDSNRPKVKVGPRPSIDSSMRPDAAGGSDQAVRPTASLPSGVRLPSRKGVPPRPNSQQSQKMFSLQIPKIPSQGSTPAPPPVTPINATAPQEKIPPIPNHARQTPVKAADLKSPKMTPEKRRLMKALEIRKKQMAAQHASKAPAEEASREVEEKDKIEDKDVIEDEGKIEDKSKIEDEDKTGDIAPAVNVTKPTPVETPDRATSEQPDLAKVEENTPQVEDLETSKEIPREAQDSPISAPEPSDGPSTQASSITEEEVPLMYKPEEPETMIPTNIHKDAPGLQDILREQTQGPIVTIEEFGGLSEPPAIADNAKDNMKEEEQKSSIEEGISNPPVSTRPGLSSARVEGDIARDSAKTTSIVSEASSVRTETGKTTTPSVEPASTPEEPPEASHENGLPHETTEVTEPSLSTSQLGSAEGQKETLLDDNITPGTEEPESPFLIEGHSVQTSASPSVVNLLDGLSASTHNGSILPSPGMKAAQPVTPQGPSLFNMVGGFGDSDESIETPLSAVREESEVTPGASQSGNEIVLNDPLERRATSIQPSNNEALNLQKDSEKPLDVENHLSSAERAQLPVADQMEPMSEDLANGSPATQKTRPRTTSKTFQFPAKSRSLSRGEKPSSFDLPREAPSLDLPREGTNSDRQSSEITNSSANDSRRNTVLLSSQKVQFAVEPEVQSGSQQTPQRSRSTTTKSERRVEPTIAASPAPESISHASSKALRLLGFDASHSEGLSGVRPESVVKSNASAHQEVSTGVERVARSEVLPASKLEAKALTEDEPEVLQERLLEPSSDLDLVPGRSNRADSAASNTAKDVEGDNRTDVQSKRRGVVEPVKRVSTPEASEEQFLSDDSFMEELKSAKMQEAKPVSVSRSPIRPDYLRSDTDPKINEIRGSRMVSNPLGISGSDVYGGSSVSRPATAVSLRSFSGTILPRPDVKTSPSTPTAQAKKFGVSSGISQRIKALETKSSRPNSPILPTPSSPGFLNLRKSSFSSERNYDLRRSRASSAYPSPQTSPDMGGPEPLTQPYQQRGETVSVTATIVRDPSDKSPRAPRKSANTPTLNLHESPLVVEHQIAEPPKQQQVMGPPQYSPLKPPRPRYSRYSSTKSVSSSSTEPKADVGSHSRRGSVASMRSGMSSRDGSETDLQRAMTDKSPNTGAPLDNIREEKRSSRSSRLLKRMSSVTSMSRRSIAQAISPSPRSASIMEREEAIEETPFFSTIDLGEVNIQFPDTLLWKRRHMTITDGGILTLSPSQSDKNPRITTKTYPLTTFRPPYIPDQDRQELPHSILLDFHDGSSLQCACENPGAQGRLLKSLGKAHAEASH